MKYSTMTILTLLSTMALAYTAQAHDPAEHMKDAENPNCAAMNDMDHSKMDMNDPVMKAMMTKCMESMHADEEATETSMDGHSAHMNHDASQKDATQPNCAAMNEMDHSKMDMADPAMQAMMKKCMQATHDDDETSGTPDNNNDENPEASEGKPAAEHSH